MAACPRQTGPRRRLVRRNQAVAALPRPGLTSPLARVSGPPPARALPLLPPRRGPRAPLPEPAQPRDTTRAEKEEVIYLNLSDLHPFKDHPFGVRDDAEIQGLVESVRSGGVNQPALVHPREEGP